MSALAAGFLEQPHIFYGDRFIDGLHHIVNRQRRHGGSNHRFHFDTGLRARSCGGFDREHAVIAPTQRDVNLRERERVRERNQVCGLLGGHDPRQLRSNERVAF